MSYLPKILNRSKNAFQKFSIRTLSIDKGVFVMDNLHYIKMPSVMDSQEGTVDKWIKNEGDSFNSGESICEVSMSGFSLAIEESLSGILTEIIIPNGKSVEAEHPIASYVTNKQDYMSYIEKKRTLVEDMERMEDTKEVLEEKTKLPDTMVLMREIKHLIQNGAIDENSDFAKKLQSQARKGNAELMSVFTASFDGSSFNSDTFDVKFFLDNAKEVIAEINDKKHLIDSVTESGSTKKKFTGLSNQGATCYLNGLLQTLFMTPEFRKAVFTWIYNVDKDGDENLCIPLQLQRLFGLLQLSKQTSVDTVALTKSFGWDSSEVFQQQDVQELTRVLFDALEESFKSTEVENIIDELYAGQLIDYLKCIDVDYESERVDKFLDFSLAIVPFGSTVAMHSITECIEMFLRPEILNGDNKYYAEKFDRKVDAIKGLKFNKLPQIMSVQLKRFVYDFTGMDIVQKKLNDVVKFPMVLDMNKYVATVRRQQQGQTTSEVESANEFDPNLEFEAFLKEQLEMLNKETNAATIVNSTESTCNSDVVNGGSDYGNIVDIDEGPAVSDDTVDIDDDEDDDDEMPSLVDYTGAPAPDQIRVNDIRHKKESEALKEKRFYGSMSDDAIRQMLQERGEWIYELYAVLIHSGAISGGHYYAYIKDVESQCWYNFNDSTVTPIDEQTVQQAWGGNITVTNYSHVGSYGGNGLINRGQASTVQRLNSANAYMLMYRKVSSATLGKIAFPTDDCVPQYIQEIVKADEARKVTQLRDEEESRNRLKMKVYWRDREHVVVTSKLTTYVDFLRQVWTQLNLGPHLMEQDAIENPSLDISTGSLDAEDVDDKENAKVESTTVGVKLNGEPLLDRFRLRYYSPSSKQRSDTFDLEKIGDSKTLQELCLYDYRPLIVETRSSQMEPYDVYYADGISILVEEFISESKTFTDVRNVRLPKGSTLADLKTLLSKSTPYPVNRIQVFKIQPMGHVDARLEVLTDDSKLLREQYFLYEGARVYVEEKSAVEEDMEKESLQPLLKTSPAFEVLLQNRSRVEILVNKPPGIGFDHLVTADLRWKVSDLRRRVQEVLELDESVDIRMFKLSSRGQELKDDGLMLSASGIFAGTNLFVSLGKALRVGMHQLMIMLYTPMEGKAGVVPLPELEPEDFTASAAVKSVNSNTTNNDWTTKTKLDLQQIHQDIDRINTQHYEQDIDITNITAPPLVFPETSSSSAAATSVMYRRCGRDEDSSVDDEDANISVTPISGGVNSNHDDIDSNAVDGLICLIDNKDKSNPKIAVGERLQFEENIQNLINTTELPTVPGSDGQFGHFPSPSVHSEDDHLLTTLDLLKHETTSAVPLVLSDSHVNFQEIQSPQQQDPDSVIILAGYDYETEATCVPCKAVTVTPTHTVVEPSGFGELTVKNQCPPSVVFTCLEELGDIVAENTTTIADLRQRICDRLIDIGKLPAFASPRRVRLRDKVGSNPGKLLKDGRTIGESKVYLFDNKSLAVQILDSEEIMESSADDNELGDALICIQRWHRKTWSLGERFEVLLKGTMTVRDVARALAKLTDIPVDSMLALVIPRDSELYLSELQMKSPTRNYGRGWFSPSKETKLLKFMSHELKVQDGDLLLLQDATEPLMELSLADLQSIAIVEAAGGVNYCDTFGPVNFTPSYHSYPTVSYASTGSSGSNSSGKSSSSAGGIRIKTHQERLRESEKQQNGSSSDLLSSTGDNVNKNNASPIDPKYETAEDKEVIRQGGMALFSDLV